jgi:hypothetical protein
MGSSLDTILLGQGHFLQWMIGNCLQGRKFGLPLLVEKAGPDFSFDGTGFFLCRLHGFPPWHNCGVDRQVAESQNFPRGKLKSEAPSCGLQPLNIIAPWVGFLRWAVDLDRDRRMPWPPKSAEVGLGCLVACKSFNTLLAGGVMSSPPRGPKVGGTPPQWKSGGLTSLSKPK